MSNWGSKTPHLAEIKAAWDAGVRASVIAELFDFTPGYLSHLARRMGWPKRDTRFKSAHPPGNWNDRVAVASLQRDGGARG